MDYSNPFAQFLNRPQQQQAQNPQMGQQQALVDALRQPQPQQQQVAPNYSSVMQPLGMGGNSQMMRGMGIANAMLGVMPKTQAEAAINAASMPHPELLTSPQGG